MLQGTLITKTLGRSLCVTVLLMLLSLIPVIASTSAVGGRVVAIGDIHGEIDGVERILREAGLMDSENNWIGGDTTLVQTGDIVDRGAGVRHCGGWS